jgi:hypothetical protein
LIEIIYDNDRFYCSDTFWSELLAQCLVWK